jgi:hypothetical protein
VFDEAPADQMPSVWRRRAILSVRGLADLDEVTVRAQLRIVWTYIVIDVS